MLHDLAVFDGMCAQLCARESRVERIVVVVDELLAVDSATGIGAIVQAMPALGAAGLLEVYRARASYEMGGIL